MPLPASISSVSRNSACRQCRASPMVTSDSLRSRGPSLAIPSCYSSMNRAPALINAAYLGVRSSAGPVG